MTITPPDSPLNQDPSARDQSDVGVDNASTDPLLDGGDTTPSRQFSEEQQPRGQRQRRTTLPRATRGWSRAIVWSLIGLTVFSAIYGLLARIDSSIEAPGQLKPIGGVTNVSPPFNSLVQRVLVREGQLVQAGQPLLLLRNDALRKQRRRLVAISASWRKEVAVLASQLGLSSELPNDTAALRQLQVGELEVQLRRLAAQEEAARIAINTQQQISELEGFQRKLTINQQITERMRPLQRAGAISRLEMDRQIEREVEVDTAVRRTRMEIDSARRREQESLYKVQQISAANFKQLFTAFDNARNQLLESENRLLELDERIALSSLRSPVSGRVFDLSVRPGEMASPARPSLKIVPETDLEAAVDITNKDIGFVRVGMPVEVRVASFPFTDYGALRGRIVRISIDALPADATHPQNYFQATVRLSSSNLRREGITYDLRPGMAVTGLLQLGPRPVIALLSDRFAKFFDSSRSIR